MFRCRIKANKSYRFFLYDQFSLEPLDKGMLDGRTSPVVPLVCENCGYTELRATNVKALMPYKRFGGGAK